MWRGLRSQNVSEPLSENACVHVLAALPLSRPAHLPPKYENENLLLHFF